MNAVIGPLPHSPWGPFLGSYFVIVGIPSGVTLTHGWLRSRAASAADSLEWYAVWAAFGTLTLASLVLVVDLGRPERFFLMLTQFSNLGSPISIGAKLIAVKAFLLAMLLYVLDRRRRAIARTQLSGDVATPDVGRAVHVALLWLIGIVSVGLAIYPVSVLSRTWVAPLAGTSGAGLIYLLTALLMGMATLLLIFAWTPLPPGPADALKTASAALTFLLYAYGIVLVLEWFGTRDDQPARAALRQVLTGAYAPAFWGLTVVLGVAFPLVLLSTLRRRSRWVPPLAAAAVLVGAGVARYLIFVAG